MIRNSEDLSSTQVPDASGHHFHLLAEYTEKLKYSCARYERVRVFVLLLLSFAGALLTIPIVVIVANYLGIGGDIIQKIKTMISQEILVFAGITAVLIAYVSAIIITLLKKAQQSRRTLLESSKLLSRLLSRASQKYDQGSEIDEESRLEMEIRLVEAENALNYAEKLATPNGELIISVGSSVAALLGAIIALITSI